MAASQDLTRETMLRSVQRVTDAQLAYLSLEDLLAELLGRVRTLLGVDTAAILLLDPDRNVLVARAARGIEEEVREGVRIPVGAGFAGRIAAELRPVAIEDVDHAEILNPLLRQRGIQSLLGVPLVAGGRPVGVLHVGSLKRRRFSENDVQLLQLVADRAALAIENAQLSEQRALTEVLQRTLLPDSLPVIPGLRFSAKYLATQTGVRLGGDWYDVITLPGGRVGVAIGDVVGHGIVAASVMAEIRTALRAYAQIRSDPRELFELLNDLLLDMGRRRSATLAMFSLDLETGQLSAINAGHLPALLLRSDGSHEWVAHSSGPPLGVLASPGYAVETLQLSAGSSLLLYTDGLVERRGEEIDTGLERLVEAAARRDGQLSLADRVFRSLVHDRQLDDDVAILAVESIPIGSHLHMTLEARPTVLAGMRRALARWLAEHDATDDERFDVVLAVSEAAANAIEHAYGPGNATFSVSGEVTGGEVHLSVTDHGSWRSDGHRQRGRGLAIMHQVMDDLNVDRTRTGTVVTMRKQVGGR